MEKVGIDSYELTNSYMMMEDFIEMMDRYRGDELSFEQRLNMLRITNVQNLGRLKKADEDRLLKTTLENAKAILEQEKQQAKSRVQAVLDEKKLAGELSEEQYEAELERRLGLIDEEFEYRVSQKKQEAKDDLKNLKKKLKNEAKMRQKETAENLFGTGKTFTERREALKEIFTVKDANGNEIEGASKKDIAKVGFTALTNALSDMAKQLDNQIDKIGEKKGLIDTRLQGTTTGWDDVSKQITGIAGVSPLLKQSALAERVSSMVGEGIAFNVLQRATLQEMSSKIATTFDATNSTLLRMVRIQQEDTTAGRLGMESALTSFLNSMYETTEYMQSIASSIKGSLEESMALMSGKEAVEFEYQVQK